MKKDGIQLLKQRGYLMQHKLPEGEYSMLAIIGLEVVWQLLMNYH